MPLIILLFTILSVLNGEPVKKEKAVQDDPMANCIQKSSFQWGSNCKSCYNSSKSYRVNLKNVCSEKIDVKVVVQERTKRWRSFYLNNMAPGDTISGYACEGTGKYVFWTKAAGDNNIVFPTDEEIANDLSFGK